MKKKSMFTFTMTTTHKKLMLTQLLTMTTTHNFLSSLAKFTIVFRGKKTQKIWEKKPLLNKYYTLNLSSILSRRLVRAILPAFLRETLSSSSSIVMSGFPGWISSSSSKSSGSSSLHNIAILWRTAEARTIR